MLVTENRLDEWVRGNAQHAQGLIVELVWRLVAASSPNPTERRFPLGDSDNQHGPDGILDAVVPFEPYVPEGRSVWQVGTGQDARQKASDDYDSLVRSIPEPIDVAESSYLSLLYRGGEVGDVRGQRVVSNPGSARAKRDRNGGMSGLSMGRN